jgi:CBS domain-containing protein
MAQIEKEAGDPKTEFWMGIAGPIMSAVVGLVCLAVASLLGWAPHALPATPVLAVLVWLGYINLLLAAFNMIPGFPLDGGRVLRAIVWWINHDERRATFIAARVGQLIAVAFIGWGVFRFFTGAGLGGLWLAFIGWFLMQAAGGSYMQVEASAALRGLKVRDVMSQECGTVQASASLSDFVHDELLRTGRRCYVVLDGEQMVGMVTPHEVRRAPPERWIGLRVADVMLPNARIHAINPDSSVYEALEVMGREDVNQLPVISGGRLQGILTRGHVVQLLQARAELERAA